MSCLTFAKAALFAAPYGQRGACPCNVASRKSRPDAQTLSHALTIAWDLLTAADDPATARERADETRRHNLVRAAETSDSMTDLWLAALNAVVDGNAFRRAG
jgi:hypothetical protein